MDLKGIIIRNDIKLKENFEKYSLLTNSCDIAAKHYRNKPNNTRLDPMGNIPDQYRTAVEFIHPMQKQQLMNYYSSQSLYVISENYFTHAVSILDALLEDIYEYFLVNENDNLSERELSRHVQFGDEKLPDVLLTYFTEYENVLSRSGTPEETNLFDYFLQYNVYRQFRHALVHNDGKLKERHKTRLTNLFQKITERQPALNTNFDSYSKWLRNDKLLIDIEFICQMEYFRKLFSAQLLSNADALEKIAEQQ